jgi:hypothetical protein
MLETLRSLLSALETSDRKIFTISDVELVMNSMLITNGINAEVRPYYKLKNGIRVSKAKLKLCINSNDTMEFYVDSDKLIWGTAAMQFDSNNIHADGEELVIGMVAHLNVATYLDRKRKVLCDQKGYNTTDDGLPRDAIIKAMKSSSRLIR